MTTRSRSRERIWILALTAAVVVAGCASTPTPSADARRKLVAGIEADLRANPTVPGEAVAVRAPGLDLTVAAGLADRKGNIALEPDTPFRIASVTKTFVAVAILELVEQGRVELDAPISRYLSAASTAALRDGGYDVEVITVRQLLRHTAGLFDYATSPGYDELNTTDPGHHWTRAEQLRFAMDHGRPVAPPGARYHYSDTGYILLGEILERVTGESLATAVRSLVDFEKLGLRHTYWERLEPAPPGTPERAHQYYGEDYDNIRLDPSADLYGGGGLISTVSDLTRFYRALFHGRVFRSDATLTEMVDDSGPGRHAGAGMGIFTVDVAGERCYQHAGYWGTEVTYCPKLDLTFARTHNQADDSDFDDGPLESVIAGLVR